MGIYFCLDAPIDLNVLVEVCSVSQLLLLVERPPRLYWSYLCLIVRIGLLLFYLLQLFLRHFVTFLRFIALHRLLARVSNG